MGGATSAGDDHLQAPIDGSLSEGQHLQGCAMRREHPHLTGHPEALQQLHRRRQGGQVGIAAHDHGHPGGGGGHGEGRVDQGPRTLSWWHSQASGPPRFPVPWLTNLRLPQGRACGHGRDQRWRVAIDDDGRIRGLEPLPAGSRAAGDDWGGDWLSPMGVDLQINGG